MHSQPVSLIPTLGIKRERFLSDRPCQKFNQLGSGIIGKGFSGENIKIRLRILLAQQPGNCDSRNSIADDRGSQFLTTNLAIREGIRFSSERE